MEEETENTAETPAKESIQKSNDNNHRLCRTLSTAKKLGPPLRTALPITPSTTFCTAARRVPIYDACPKTPLLIPDDQENALCQALSKALDFKSASTSKQAAGASIKSSMMSSPVLNPPWQGFSSTQATSARGQLGNAEPQLGRVNKLTPVRASKVLMESLGSSQVLTPVRRSSRKIKPAGDSTNNQEAEVMLEITNYSYTPNKAINLDGS
ncbi:hypothetical protein CEUSTIGMA_g482.t1 [Chlamydomonas eustigma]|uniref:Uncharacterized protein n=1 Tax=Chlamydomonas eustigma TaxID=1157962 RepID=A0A250WR56_9CHLO|nr:hypothetical protein CEUSTIGMA_g482.t1 [Chlamydomonas eustigma]|eukprot:GAX73030.1 hypothetical protein CEUSTIGMA_g482.t1 [Chlamydomonas eustigma]